MDYRFLLDCSRRTQRAVEARNPPWKETLKGMYCQKIRLGATVLKALPNQAVGDEGLEPPTSTV